MAILAFERFENVRRSLYNHIASNYTLTSFQLQGETDIDTRSIDEWVWFGIQGSTRQFLHHVTSDTYGNLVTFFFTSAIYVKPTDNLSRIDLIRDTIVNLFQRKAIQVTDYVGNAAAIGRVISNEPPEDVPLGLINDINQHAVTFRMKYLEQFS